MAHDPMVLIPSPMTSCFMLLFSKAHGSIVSTLLGIISFSIFHEYMNEALPIVFNPSDRVIEEKKLLLKALLPMDTTWYSFSSTLMEEGMTRSVIVESASPAASDVIVSSFNLYLMPSTTASSALASSGSMKRIMNSNFFIRNLFDVSTNMNVKVRKDCIGHSQNCD